MSFLTGKTKTVDNTPKDTVGTRNAVGDFLTGGQGYGPGTSSAAAQWEEQSRAIEQMSRGQPPIIREMMMSKLGPRPEVSNPGLGAGAGSDPIARIFQGNTTDEEYMARVLAPYSAMFAANRASALGQAKESAGNLTGSGYNNILGSAAAQSIAGENLQMAQIRQAIEQGNQGAFLQLLTSFQNGGTPTQQVYQPGFLDYGMQALGIGAGIYGGRRQDSAGTSLAPLPQSPITTTGAPNFASGYNVSVGRGVYV